MKTFSVCFNHWDFETMFKVSSDEIKKFRLTECMNKMNGLMVHGWCMDSMFVLSNYRYPMIKIKLFNLNFFGKK